MTLELTEDANGYVIDRAEELHDRLANEYGSANVEVWDDGEKVYADVECDKRRYSQPTYKLVVCIACGGMQLTEKGKHPYNSRSIHIGSDDCVSADSEASPHISANDLC